MEAVELKIGSAAFYMRKVRPIIEKSDLGGAPRGECARQTLC